jgi:hypothetical protein
MSECQRESLGQRPQLARTRKFEVAVVLFQSVHRKLP